MTPEESALLAKDAEATVTNILFMTCIVFTYGIYLPVFCMAHYEIYPRLRSNVPARWLYVLQLVLFAAFTSRFVSEISYQVIFLKWPTFGALEDSIRTKFYLNNIAFAPSRTSATISGNVLMAVADTMVVWRAYVLWPSNRGVRICLVVACIINLAIGLAVSIWNVIQSSVSENPNVALSMNILQGTMSLTVNLFATGFIALRARMVKSHGMGVGGRLGKSRPSPVTRVLILLLEGGIVLAVLQAVLLGLLACDDDDAGVSTNRATRLMVQLTLSFGAVYPSIMIILLAKERSVIDNSTFVIKVSPTIPSERKPDAEHGDPNHTHLTTLQFAAQKSTVIPDENNSSGATVSQSETA